MYYSLIEKYGRDVLVLNEPEYLEIPERCKYEFLHSLAKELGKRKIYVERQGELTAYVKDSIAGTTYKGKAYLEPVEGESNTKLYGKVKYWECVYGSNDLVVRDLMDVVE